MSALPRTFVKPVSRPAKRPSPARIVPPARPVLTVTAAAHTPSAASVPAPPVARATPTPQSVEAAIYSASAKPQVVHAGEVVEWNVRTSRAVTSVAAKSAGFTIPLEKRGPGAFGLSFRIPDEMPPLFRGTYAVTVEARAANGSSATAHLSLDLR